MLESYKQFYTKRQQNNLCRTLDQTTLNHSYLDFSSNDYLGLSKSPVILEAATLAAKEFGVGSTGSRLLSGNPAIFSRFENQIAHDKKTETALLFNSGFQANLSVLASLLDKKVLGQKPLVFFDKLNHASLYQAVFTSGAELIRYQHNDLNHLNDLLKKHHQQARPKFIVTETVFGMDGDVVQLPQLLTLAANFHALLYLDEAHATGILGQTGYGLSTDVDLQAIPHVVMGTFSKALGCFGAYIACSNIIKNFLINHSAGFIYATSLPPLVVGAAATAWELIKDYSSQRQMLLLNAAVLRQELQNLGFDTQNSRSQIIPVVLKHAETVMQVKEKLFQHKIIVSAVRPPTVPPNTSRLRITLTVDHTAQDIAHFINAMKTL